MEECLWKINQLQAKSHPTKCQQLYPHQTEITKINNGTTFEVGQAITNASAIDDPSYIYHDAGVLNYTTYEVVTVTDTSTLILDTVLGIQPGYYIKSIGKAGTEHLQEVATVNDATNTITTVSPTTGDILAGDKIIAERARCRVI